MEWYWAGFLLFFLLALTIFAGIHIAVSLGGICLIGLAILIGPGVASDAVAQNSWYLLNNFAFVALPLFIFMSEILTFAGVGGDLFDTISKWTSRIPGALAVASIAACAVFAALCGASIATAAAVGTLAVPEMIRHGYSKRLATGSVAAGGTLGVLIPPSVLMILYGLYAEQSIAKLFIAGVIPGLILAGMMSIYVVLYARHRPNIAPRLPSPSWRERWASLRKTIAPILLIITVLGTIYTGVVTPMEAAAIGVVGAIIIAVVYQKATPSNLLRGAMAAVRTTCFVGFIMVGATAFGLLMSYLRIPQGLTQLLVTAELPTIATIALIMLFLIFLGCLMDPAPILLVTIPIILPIVILLGVDLIWFGVLFVINMEIAAITPPVGLNLYVIKGISPPEVELGDVLRGTAPFILIEGIFLVIIMLFPQVALWLPNMMR